MSDETEIPVPGVLAAYGYAWKQLWPNFLMLFVVMIVYLLFNVPTQILSYLGEDSGNVGVPLAGVIWSLFVVPPVGYGFYYVCLRAVRGEAFGVGNLFEPFRNYVNVILAIILTGLIVVAGAIFLIVPGVIFACKLVFVPFLVVDKRMSVIEAIKASWSMTNGHALEVFLIGLLAIPIVFLGMLALIVGVLVSALWITLAIAALYYAVSAQSG